jgi:excisionase family DNA binding protein
MESRTVEKRQLLLGYREACQACGLTYWTLYNLVHTGKIRALKPSKTTILFYADELAEDIDALRIGPKEGLK